MNAERLLEVYEQISEAPDAIARLRRFVLDLAVRGKLVEPIAVESTGAALAHRIAADKAKKEKVGLIKPPNSPKGATHDTALKMPEHWQPVLMVDILDELQTGPFGSSLKKSDYAVGGVPVINPASIVNEAIRPVAEMAVGEKTLERLASFKLKRGDIVMARRGEMGRCALVGETETGWLCGTGSLILRPSKLLFSRYLVLLIGSPYSRNYLAGSAVGATMQNLNQNILLSMPFGLPPEPEQRRIVAKVDELMALCDRLEEARKTREEVRDKLTAASLARLTAPDTASEDFPTHAAFALEALPGLTTRPDQIKTLRQTILNLAVRGKLVEQDPADEPASKLLQRIKADRQQRTKTKTTRNSKPLSMIGADELPFDLPPRWVWARLGDIIYLISGQHLQPAEYCERNDTGLPYITGPSDFSANGAIVRRIALVRKAVATKGQLLITVKGSGVGKAMICDLDEVAISRQLMAMEPLGWSIGFLELITDRLAVKLQGEARSLIPGISRDDINEFAVALPPLAEQHRIVAKVDVLMNLCDQLEAALTTADTTRTRLLEALLHEALEPRATVQEAAE